MTVTAGIELHTVPASPEYLGSGPRGGFKRLIRVGSRVWVRTGDRGTEGTLHVTPHRNAEKATIHMEELARAASRRGYAVAFASRPSYLDVRHVRNPDYNPEPAFLAHWYDTVRSETAAETTLGIRRAWVSITGLSGERGANPTADALWDYLTAAPHAHDAHEDRLVARSVRIPYLGQGFGPFAAGDHSNGYDAKGGRLRASLFPPSFESCAHAQAACPACATRHAELLCFLARGVDLTAVDADERTRMVDAARRLTTLAAPLPPTPVSVPVLESAAPHALAS